MIEERFIGNLRTLGDFIDWKLDLRRAIFEDDKPGTRYEGLGFQYEIKGTRTIDGRKALDIELFTDPERPGIPVPLTLPLESLRGSKYLMDVT